MINLKEHPDRVDVDYTLRIDRLLYFIFQSRALLRDAGIISSQNGLDIIIVKR